MTDRIPRAMRRPVLLGLLVLATVLMPVEAAAAGHPDLPTGFTDGIPVGEGIVDPDDDGADPGRPTVLDDTGRESMMVPMAAPGPRYIGKGPWDTIRGLSASVPRPSGCSVSADDLTAMVFAPIFKESSAATSPSAVGSPMTLSRYDEWTSGVRNGNTNQNANYGLYENRDPYTPYQRAYWHPGIGLWQYDSAGVGAPFTAAERIDVRIVGENVVTEMLGRYCRSSGESAFDKRRSAWSPWLQACTTSDAKNNACEEEFQNMRSTNPSFARVHPVAGVTATGGMVKRQCAISGATHDCWYVDPNRAEGTRSWQFTPGGEPGPTTYPAPLSHPFYVVKRNGHEERHWLRDDTGYPVDISARRQLGKNARPRNGTIPNEVGSGLAWSRSSDLCDITTGRGACVGGEAFVKAVYVDYIGRLPTRAELTAGVAVVGGGASSAAARARFSTDLSRSATYVDSFLNKLYRDTLGRDGDPAGLAHWRQQLLTGRRTPAQVGADFYASPEYFRNIGGNTTTSWVTDLYTKLLLRRPDADGLNHWVRVANGQGRRAVSLPMYQSPESAKKRVDALYLRFLGRGADPGGRDHWARQIVRHGDLVLATELTRSNEYLNRAKLRFP